MKKDCEKFGFNAQDGRLSPFYTIFGFYADFVGG